MSLIRINKRMADLGYCSRREADKLISQKKVKVNGSIVNDLGLKVTKNDRIEVESLADKKDQVPRVWLYNKPVGQIVSNKDEFGRPIIFDFLPKKMPRVVTVGRLDINSEGLLILTNKSSISHKLEAPGNNYERVYKVRVFGVVDVDKLLSLQDGVSIDKVQYKKSKISILKQGKNNTWLQISLFEGKNREIRKLMEHVGLRVNRLIRLQYGPFKLADLKPGKVKELKEEELEYLV